MVFNSVANIVKNCLAREIFNDFFLISVKGVCLMEYIPYYIYKWNIYLIIYIRWFEPDSSFSFILQRVRIYSNLFKFGQEQSLTFIAHPEPKVTWKPPKRLLVLQPAPWTLETSLKEMSHTLYIIYNSMGLFSMSFSDSFFLEILFVKS